MNKLGKSNLIARIKFSSIPRRERARLSEMAEKDACGGNATWYVVSDIYMYSYDGSYLYIPYRESGRWKMFSALSNVLPDVARTCHQISLS